MFFWRVGRDVDGWKLGMTAWIKLISSDAAFDKEEDINLPFNKRKQKCMAMRQGPKPDHIMAVPRLYGFGGT